ncbi:hypothetical protein KHA96_10500 [Bacillus sp. FJAT-49711]|uniref:hypothetical protein n=1 Tax=Bacillus sp. FJAT-49711 TaxID=2833585 RepID=UPI001BC930C8|nr:hypothetical protein [Bacillus sp. FJAT-49711]MBS4218742.1 hypothetical protein [Bacillus sp. FJAT-49711]
MMNLYTLEKIMEQEKKSIQRKANQAWMHSNKHNRHFKKTSHELLEILFQKFIASKKRSRKMYDS